MNIKHSFNVKLPSIGHFDGRAANHSKSSVDDRSSSEPIRAQYNHFFTQSKAWMKTSVIFEFSTSTVKMASSDNDSVPHISDMDSPGSSVSSALQREYEELLKYAVVTPKIQLCPTIYEQSVTTKDNVTASTETDSNSSSSTSSSTSVSTRSSKSEEVSHTAAKEVVKQLPNTPSLRLSFQGQGSIARDSLLRDGKLISSLAINPVQKRMPHCWPITPNITHHNQPIHSF